MRHSSLFPAILLVLASTEARAQPVATPAWESGFEMGFPGEFLDYDEGSWNPSGQQNSDAIGSTWTIIDDGPIFSGERAYKGWIHAESDENHRPYPMVHVDIPTPLVNSFMVYVDMNYAELGGGDWIHVGTWANNEDWDVHTMSIVNRKLEIAHVEDAEEIPDELPDFPLRQWVRLTVYIHYAPEGDGTVVVWQDGEPMLRGRYTVMSGQNLLRAHWGLYAPGSVSNATQYNDEIRIWTLSEPLTDFSTEPTSPYGPSEPPPADAGTGSAGTDAGSDSPPTMNSGSGGRNAAGGQGGRAGGSSGTGGRGGSSGSNSSSGVASGGGSGATGGTGGAAAGNGSREENGEDSGCTVASGPGATGSAGPLSLLLASLGVLYSRRRTPRARRA